MDVSGDVTPHCTQQETKLYCGGDSFPTARVDALTGHLDWSSDALVMRSIGMNDSEPVGVHGGLVFVQHTPSDTTAELVALDADSGDKKWAEPISTGLDSALFDDMVISSGPDDQSLIARDEATGETRW
uniref:outer membrane protein assembly factor BamB family protein n=1 Tax=Streptomyces milbemycinicus TaxID=476552 RepID=UPI001302D30B